MGWFFTGWRNTRLSSSEGYGQREMDRLIITYCDRGVASSMTISSDTGACTGFPVTPSGAPAPRRSSGAPPVHEGPVTPSREGWLTSRTWKGQDRAGEQRAAHRRRPADTRPGVRSAAQRVAGGAPQPDRLRRPGRSTAWLRARNRQSIQSVLFLLRPDICMCVGNGKMRPGGKMRRVGEAIYSVTFRKETPTSAASRL